MTTPPTVRLGTVQRAILLVLADGTPRSVDRIESDAMLSHGRAYSALMGLARRGYIDRDHTSGHGAILWFLSRNGQALAEQVHHLDDEHEQPRCPHSLPLDGPCKACRIGNWSCSGCSELVRGGQRGPHRREHNAKGEPIPTFTWHSNA